MITVKEAAAKWGVTPVRVRQLLQGKRIAGAYKLGRDWLIPNKALYPAYHRNWARSTSRDSSSLA
jgi:excisionase family DNA binding protein